MQVVVGAAEAFCLDKRLDSFVETLRLVVRRAISEMEPSDEDEDEDGEQQSREHNSDEENSDNDYFIVPRQ